MSRNELDDEIRRGWLVAVFPHVYCRPWDVDDPEVRIRAALMSVGRPVVLSHLSALARWGLADPPPQIHVAVPTQRVVRPRQGVIVHRVPSDPNCVLVDGVPCVCAAVAIVSSWGSLGGHERRAPVIDGSRRRVVTCAELTAEISRRTRVRNRAELVGLVDLLEAGCESELEIWGLLHLFDHAGLRHAEAQTWVRAHGRWYRLDRAFVVERVAVELDGDRYHSSDQQRENDRRRDAALAGLGWVTVRLSYRRLHHDLDGCRRDLLAVLARRRPEAVA